MGGNHITGINLIILLSQLHLPGVVGLVGGSAFPSGSSITSSILVGEKSVRKRNFLRGVVVVLILRYAYLHRAFSQLQLITLHIANGLCGEF